MPDKNPTRLKMSLLFEKTVEAIFKRFDVNQTGILTYPLFKAFCDSVGRKLNPQIFDQLLSILVSTKYTTNKPKSSSLKTRSADKPT